MAVKWHLKTFLLEKHRIHSLTEIQKRIVNTTGVKISLQNLCNLINKKPSSVRLKTMEILCTAFCCQLSDFCEVSAGKLDPQKKRYLSPQTTTNKARQKQHFPDPNRYG